MKKLALNLVICAFAIINKVSAMQSWELRGDAYQSQLAKDKFATIWSQVTLDTDNKQWYDNTFDQMMAEDMHPTMNWQSDTVPYDDFWGKREKFIHTQGVTCAIKFTPTQTANGYTGMLGSGADYGLIRFSIGTPADPTQPAENNFGPAFAVKFLRDGGPSANLVASNDVQTTWNYFQNDNSNLIGVAGDPILSKFKTATDYPQRSGLLDFAQYDQTGAEVDSPIFPFNLVFSPSDSIKKLFPDAYTAPFTEQLSTLTKDTVLFNVYAVPEPKADKTLIGTITLTQDATTSFFGDAFLWFKHQDSKYEVAIKPDWKKYLSTDPTTPHDKDIDASSFQEAKPSSGCPFQKMKKAINDMVSSKKAEAKNFLSKE
eukprot:403373824